MILGQARVGGKGLDLAGRSSMGAQTSCTRCRQVRGQPVVLTFLGQTLATSDWLSAWTTESVSTPENWDKTPPL